MSYTLSITPGQPIVRQIPHKHHFLDNLPLSEWISFCDGYDAIVVVPYRRAKYAMVAAFLCTLLLLMGTLTLTDAVPSGPLFLMGPCVFGIVAMAACVYMFGIYPRVSHQLEALCYETSQRLQKFNIVLQYLHNDARHDLKDHVITLAPLVPDIETAVPAANAYTEWNPLMQLRSLWNQHQNNNNSRHDH